jgi:serine/threonine protein kinase
VIHRDVKPSNILISRNGHVKICDFGISGYLVDSVAKTVDAGCKPYMAPERINPMGDPSKYDIRSDIWSLGISLVELATGTFPYERWGDPFSQLKQVVVNDPPILPNDTSRYSPELQDFVVQCLRKEYTDRPHYTGLLQHPFIHRPDLAQTPTGGEGVTVKWTDVAEFVSLVLQ